MEYLKLKKKVSKGLCKGKIKSNSYVDNNKVILELSCGNEHTVAEFSVSNTIITKDLEEQILLLGQIITMYKLKRQYTGVSDASLDGLLEELKSKISLFEQIKQEDLTYKNNILDKQTALEKRIQEIDYSLRTTDNIDVQRRLFKELQDIRQERFNMVELIRSNNI